MCEFSRRGVATLDQSKTAGSCEDTKMTHAEMRIKWYQRSCIGIEGHHLQEDQRSNCLQKCPKKCAWNSQELPLLLAPA